ncbi:MAG: stress response translation initiation inhibitor YciH [Solirubrobacterales bacterium]|nr:stress response translation initiation inhibitor YciH [Solirubrobacterales bacterium]
MDRDDSELVWSSDGGDFRKSPEGTGRRSSRKQNKRSQPAAKAAQGSRMKVRREIAGRKGKAVTTVTDIRLPESDLKALAQQLKKRCGVGGTAKNGRIELQGDHRDTVIAFLEDAGHKAVAAGG